MKQIAAVVRKDGRLMARVERPEACMQCRACDYGLNAETFAELPKGNWQEGDEVEIDLESGRVSQASLLAYGIPLAGLLIALAIASALPVHEIAQAAIGVAGALAGFGVLKIFEPKFKKFRPQIRPCSDRKDE